MSLTLPLEWEDYITWLRSSFSNDFCACIKSSAVINCELSSCCLCYHFQGKDITKIGDEDSDDQKWNCVR